jgi:hypothetical protein
MAARRRKKPVRRRAKSFNISNALFSVGYASIFTQGAFKTNAPAFFLQGVVPGVSSGSGISLSELVARPELFNQAGQNLMKNVPSMVFQAFGLSIAERVFKRAMRMPIRKINSGLITPLLGKGVRF